MCVAMCGKGNGSSNDDYGDGDGGGDDYGDGDGTEMCFAFGWLHKLFPITTPSQTDFNTVPFEFTYIFITCIQYYSYSS
jgi:hypothetical protein